MVETYILIENYNSLDNKVKRRWYKKYYFLCHVPKGWCHSLSNLGFLAFLGRCGKMWLHM